MLSTTDIYLAAALMSLGAKLDKVNREDPRHMEFQMQMIAPTEFRSKILTEAIGANSVNATMVDTPTTLEDYEKQWQNGDLLVNAVKFAEAIKRMKSVVHTRPDDH